MALVIALCNPAGCDSVSWGLWFGAFLKIGLSGRRVVLAVGALWLATGPLHADDSDIPSYRVLQCTSGCAKWVDAKRTDDSGLTFPVDNDDPFWRASRMASTSEERKSIPPHGEGYVDLRFTITADGHVRDVVVEQLVGPQIYADQAVKDVSQWTYTPATANGKPVETTNHITRAIYGFPATSAFARQQVTAAYDKASALYDAGNYADAIAAIKPELDLPRLNFYERALISLSLATSYWQLRDYGPALERIRDATFNDFHLDTNAKEIAVRLRITMEARAGHYAEALGWFEVLKKMTSIPGDDPVQNLTDKICSRLADFRASVDRGKHSLPGRASCLVAAHVAAPRFRVRLDRGQAGSIDIAL